MSGTAGSGRSATPDTGLQRSEREMRMTEHCVHSCKGLCAALSVAEHREEEALREYRRFAAECDYPDVVLILNRLIAERAQALALLRAKRAELAERFNVIDRINDSFA